MVDIDRRGLALGVALGILGQSFYDTFFYLFSGQIVEEWRASVAGMIAAGLLLLIFYRLGYLKEKEAKTITETK